MEPQAVLLRLKRYVALGSIESSMDVVRAMTQCRTGARLGTEEFRNFADVSVQLAELPQRRNLPCSDADDSPPCWRLLRRQNPATAYPSDFDVEEESLDVVTLS